MPLSIVNKGIILEISVWIKLNGFIPSLGNIINIIPTIINVREIGIIYFKDSCFLLIFIILPRLGINPFNLIQTLISKIIPLFTMLRGITIN